MSERRGLIRGLFSLAALGALAFVGIWFYWSQTAKDRTIKEQQRVIKELEVKLDRTWAEELVADVMVEGVDRDAATGKKSMRLKFVQYEPGTENPTFTRTMTLPGDEFYIDALVVKFERKFVEAGDGLRGKSLLLFRRAFGDQQKPIEGIPLFRHDGESPIPERVQIDAQPTEFERKIWTQFWDLANDPDKARGEGIKVAQGEAPHIKAVPRQVYKLTLRSSGGIDLIPRLPPALVGDGTQAPPAAPR